jgi:hypothetical protein
MCLVLSSVLLCLVLSGCASAAGSGDRGRNLDPITSEQLGEAKPEGLSALQIIERFRPRWLQSMGAINAASLSVVVVDGYWHPVVQILEIVDDRAPEITLRTSRTVLQGDVKLRRGGAVAGPVVCHRTECPRLRHDGLTPAPAGCRRRVSSSYACTAER